VLIVVAKTGNIGSSTVLELLLDERADRNDIDVRVISSGAKMGKAEAEYVADETLSLKPDLILYTTPNASAPGPKLVIEKFAGKKAVVISDAPASKMKDTLEEKGFGYIFVKGDPMIGARREFLDPTEMAIFNADVLKVLAATGALRLIQIEVGKTIDAVKADKSYLPQITVDAVRAVEHSNFKDETAKEKAVEAYELSQKVGEENVRGCFMEKDSEQYIRTVASAHELLRKAANLADEAREIEKKNDSLYRTPHSPDGRILTKTKLMEKPK